MRKTVTTILYIIIFCLMLSGCMNEQARDANPTAYTMQDLNIEESGTILVTESTCLSASKKDTESSRSPRNPATYRPQDGVDSFIETEAFYYYLNSGKIYYSEKTEPVFYLLCSKPNCAHGSEDCNAYGGGAGGALGYWDGKLYTAGWLNLELVLIRMDLDGSNHELAAKIEMPVDSHGQQGGAYQFVFADGYLYYFVNAEPQSIFRINLGSGNTERMFQNLLENGATVSSNLRFDEDFMYFILKEPSGARTLYRYMLESRDVQKLWAWPEMVYQWDVENGTVFYYSQVDEEFCELEIATGKVVLKIKAPYGKGAAYYDTNYIYLDTWEEMESAYRDLYIFDRDYNLLRHISLPHYGDYLYAAGDKLFFSNTYSYKISHYLPFSEIGTEDAELHPVKDPYALR